MPPPDSLSVRFHSVALPSALAGAELELLGTRLHGEALPQRMSLGQAHASEHLERLSAEVQRSSVTGLDEISVDASQADLVEVGSSDLLDAPAPAPAPLQAAYGLDEALSFRLMQFEATDQLVHRYAAALDTAIAGCTDARQLGKLLQARDGLAKFSQDLAKASFADVERSRNLRSEQDKKLERAATDKQVRKVKLQAAQQMLGGKLKKPFDKKYFFGLKGLPTHWRASAQRKAHERDGTRGRSYQPKGSPLHVAAGLAAHLAGILKGTGLEEVSVSKLTKQIGVEAGKVAERGPGWQTMGRHIELRPAAAGAKPQRFHNELIPAREFSPAVAQAYGPQRKGVACTNNVDPQHTVNLWQTRFSSGRPGCIEFSALRHGIHDAYGLGAEQRPAAAQAKVQQFVQAAAQAYPERLRPVPGKEGIYELPTVSVSLVSPVKIGGELAMWQNQLQAYAQANAGQPLPVQVDLGDGQGLREVLVQPRIVAFNVPVNHFALEGNALTRALGAGWDQSDPPNDVALSQLLGSKQPGAPLGGLAADQLADLERQIADLKAARAAPQSLSAERQQALRQLQARQARIGTLVQQIRQIVTADEGSDLSHHRAGHEPYKLASRLVLLVSELGLVPAFNCKSGKDRTGQLDVEVKDLIAHWEMSGQPRPINHARSDTEAANLATLFEQGGGLEIQRDNTGLPGSKLNTQAALQVLRRALGDGSKDRSLKQDIAGLSKWVGS